MLSSYSLLRNKRNYFLPAADPLPPAVVQCMIVCETKCTHDYPMNADNDYDKENIIYTCMDTTTAHVVQAPPEEYHSSDWPRMLGMFELLHIYY